MYFLAQVHSFIPQCGQISLIFAKSSNSFCYCGYSLKMGLGCVA